MRQEPIDPRRRQFLKSSALLGGGLVIAFHLPRTVKFAMAAEEPARTYPPNAFIRIGEDETVTILINKSEMGQGVYTSLAMLVADELEADWSKVRVEAAPVAPVYNHTVWNLQATGGSTSVSSSWEQLRKVGAAGRALLIRAAAETWKVKPDACHAENGHVIHKPTQRRLSYGVLSARAAELPMPAGVKLKDPKQFKLIGKPTRRLDTPAKTDGTARFGIDVQLPGLLTALVARPPVFGATLKSFDPAKSRAVAGVVDVVRIPSGIAVVAKDFWSAKKGRDVLEVVWDRGTNADLSSAGLHEEFARLAMTSGVPAKEKGDPTGVLAKIAKPFGAEYAVPYLAHAPMEPLNCTVDLREDRCEIWTGTQFQTVDRNHAAAIAGLKPEQVELHTTLLGGGFGRRGNPQSDFVSEAVHVAKAVKKPVKVVWTREDDIKGGYYRPAFYDRLTAGLDAKGRLIAWSHTLVGQSIAIGTPFESAMIRDGVDVSSVEGAADLPYAIPNVRVDLHSPRLEIPVLWWRSVGHSHTAFVVESFIDEVAHAAGKDPYRFRRDLLAKHPRHRGVLELAAKKAGWGSSLPKGRGRGIAVHSSFGSYVAQVAEVSVEDGQARAHRVVCAIDCGQVVNPDTIAAQMESGIVWALSAALHGEITLNKGEVEQSNFTDYPILRIDEMPVVEVHIVPSREPPSGVGEPGVPPLAPAVTNAVFAATGKRIRSLPLTGHDLKTV
ncbi:aerobic-type carbon monoxide dehydrogenase, large subunit CoxL/CutL-like protein [Methylocaldum marinum]|uniref:Aerobic-type carbon monoxide dehydrogenase, large subunit CoxL/CutL-like protein n=1 Tax=Methylocaldum marinum TaxID=1432792 RepID=A0A250KU09_9GAMM|nr:xanthine dehydrogenase family protein molybdopterin-binding subunit [Methylocaldum marinum]BBA34994.1 aerobic-type carbon monoxide dehydrogenase, large subunit CoxL/CutL-like protein [Methylocaldum marinum]